jgi:PKD repeat protein
MLAATAYADPVRTVARVFVPDADTFQRLMSYDVRFEDFDGFDQVRVIGSRQAVDKVIDAGFEVTILIDDLDAWVQARNADLAAHPPKAAPSDVALDHYLTYPEVETFLNDLQTLHSTIMSVETIGQSVAGRNMYVVKLSDNVDTNEAEPAAFFEFNIHGDEIAGYIIMLNFIQQMVTQYGTDPTITNLINSREIFIVPLSNPDGNQTGGFGRSRYNDHGVDLNRNFGFMWTSWESAPGAGPRSEPEVQAIASVMATGQPFEVGMGGHSGAVVFLYAWGYSGATPLDYGALDWVASQYVYPTHCQDPYFTDYGQTYNYLYQCYGTSMDEMYGLHGALGTTIETTFDKECDFATAMGVAQDHFPALLWLLGEMGNGLHGTVTSADDGSALAADILVEDRWYTFSDEDVGDFHKYLRPGAYDIKVWANGYEPYENTVTINSGAPTNLNVQLTAAADTGIFGFRLITMSDPSADLSDTLAIDALGRPDAAYVALTSGGYAVIDLGPGGIDNGAGEDLVVYDSGSGNPFTLSGSDGWNGPWTQIGTGSGTKAFDLQGAGLTSVRYVKIQDTSDLAGGTAASDGYHLDAVGTPIFMASFSGDPTTGDKPLTVQFTDQSTGDPTSWEWDFGDGETSTAQNPSHEYTEYGYYTVTLTVHKAAESDSLVRDNYIHVVEQPPVADFTGDPVTGPAPLNVQFTDASTGMIDTWFWQFGDVSNSSEQDPLHTYQSPGNYTVRLTVHGPGGSNTKTRWFYISVGQPVDDDTVVDDDTTPDDDTIIDDDTIDDDVIDDDVDDDDVDDDADDDVDDDTIVDDDAAPGDDDDDSGCGC